MLEKKKKLWVRKLHEQLTTWYLATYGLTLAQRLKKNKIKHYGWCSSLVCPPSVWLFVQGYMYKVRYSPKLITFEVRYFFSWFTHKMSPG